MHVLVIANGDISSWDRNPPGLLSADLVIAVDGGYKHCLQLEIVPDIVIGDLDSLIPAHHEIIQSSDTQIVEFPPEKDQIDLELALNHAVDQGAHEITILGGLGGRFDMSLANVSLMLQPQFQGLAIEFWHAGSRLWLIKPPGGKIDGAPGDTLSLIPLGGPASGILTSGLAYPLDDETLTPGPARGLSNVLTDKTANVSLSMGSLLAVWTPGRA